MNNETRFEMHAIVYGNVQGVGFRASTCDFAEQAGLTGTVQNCRNGNVEIYAQGTQGQLEQLLEKLQRQHRISRIEKKFNLPLKVFVGFSVLPT